MQSVKTPLLVEESVSGLSSLSLVADDDNHLRISITSNNSQEVPDNRRHIHLTNDSSASVAANKLPTTTNKKSTTSQVLPSKTISSATSLTMNDDDDDENDDGDPLLRSADDVVNASSMRKLPSTLFSPMSESGESSLVGESASHSALATPMDISRYTLFFYKHAPFLFEARRAYQKPQF